MESVVGRTDGKEKVKVESDSGEGDAEGVE